MFSVKTKNWAIRAILGVKTYHWSWLSAEF